MEVRASDGTGTRIRPFGEAQIESGRAQPVDEVTGCLPPRVLLARYVYANRPVLMRGCARNMPVMERWTDAYLSEHAGSWCARPPTPEPYLAEHAGGWCSRTLA